VVATIACTALLTIGGIVAARLAAQSPPWWTDLDPRDQVTIETARDLEHGFGNQLTLIRPAAADLDPQEPWRSDIWQVALEAPHANAWLNINLPRWMASDPKMPQWPDRLVSLRTHFESGLIHVGAALDRGSSLRFLTASVAPEIRDDGSLWLPAHGIHIGALPIPPAVVLRHTASNADQYIPSSIDEQGRTMLRVFQGLEPVALEPVIRLDDGRQVRLLKIEPRAGRLILTCRTELRTNSRAARP
jgi:hypothetical protein